eukprot:UN30477
MGQPLYNNLSHTNRIPCQIQGFLITFGSLCSALWVLNIILVLRKVSLSMVSWSVESWEKYFHGYTWLTGMIFGCLPLITHGYGNSIGYCWIKDDITVNTIWRFVCFYIPRLLIVIYACYVYYEVHGNISSST